MTAASGMVNIPLKIFWETLAYRAFTWFLCGTWEWLFLGEISNVMLLPCRPSVSEWLSVSGALDALSPKRRMLSGLDTSRVPGLWTDTWYSLFVLVCRYLVHPLMPVWGTHSLCEVQQLRTLVMLMKVEAFF